jgi:hypothetical protein
MESTPPQDKEYWFPAKRYGWGWGFPCRWQGWLVFAGFFAVVGGWVFLVSTNPGRFIPLTPVVLLCACGVLMVVCWWKGEPPRWRWGD